MGKPAQSPIIAGRRRAHSVRTPKPFLEMASNPTALARLVLGFEGILVKSFRTHPARHGAPTANMVKERFAILERWYRELRAEKKWGVARILDTLPDALSAELNGQTWQPDQRACWMPGDGK